MFQEARRPPEISSVEQSVIDRYERRSRPQRRLARYGLMLTGISLLNAYVYDINVQKDIKADAYISVETTTDSPIEPEHANRAIIAIDGFGSYNSNWLANSLGNEVQQLYDGQVWSVSYGNAPLNEKTIANAIIAKAEAENVDTVALLGDSAGGVIATEVIPYILEKSDLTVELSLLAATPSGEDGLRPNKQQEVALAKTLRTFVPGIEYSTYARGLVELMLQKDQIKDWDSFWRTQERIQTQLNDKYLPKTWLMIDQALAVSAADFPGQYQKINAMLPDEQAPVIVNLVSSDYDPIVNDDYSSQKICEAAQAATLNCSTYAVPGAVHARPDLSIESYRQVFASIEGEVTASIEENRLISQLSRLAATQVTTMPMVR